MNAALFLLPSDEMGGAERILRSLVRAAVQSRRFDSVEVFILCRPRSGTLDALEAEHGVILHYSGARRPMGGVACLLKLLATRSFTLVFSSSSHLNALCSLARRLHLLRSQRLITRESTMIFDRNFGWRGRLIRLLYKVYGAQDLIICQTEDMRTSLDRHTQGKLTSLLHVIPNPVDMTMIEAGRVAGLPPEVAAIAPDRLLIAWCGRLEPVKSPDRAITTLKALHAAGETRMHLVMIGAGRLQDALQQQAKAAGLTDYVTFAGHQPMPSSIMAHCDFGLLTSDREGFPNVILEMLACGISWVVTTDCAGGLSSLPGVRVVAVTPTITEDLAMVMRNLKNTPPDPGICAHVATRTASGFMEKMLAQANKIGAAI